MRHTINHDFTRQFTYRHHARTECRFVHKYRLIAAIINDASTSSTMKPNNARIFRQYAARCAERHHKRIVA